MKGAEKYYFLWTDSHINSPSILVLKNIILAESRENLSLAFPTRSETNWAVQPQKMARGLKFQIKEVEGLYYICCENKGADQLCDHRAADLRLCFSICKKQVFS